MNERATRGFPIGIAIIREGPYGATTSRNVYADELTPEELAERESKGLGYPHPVEIARLTNPTSSSQDPEPSDLDSPRPETSGESVIVAAAQASELEASTPSGASSAIREPEQTFASSVLVRTNAPHDVIASNLPPDFSRHARRCVVCAHPDRDAIEGDFIRWSSPSAMAKTYKIADRASIYRHAHSTGLFDRRKREVGRVLETVLENVEQCPVESFDTIIRAARLYTRLDNTGTWVEPPRITYFIAGPPPGSPAVPAAPPQKRKTRSSKSKRFLTATRPHSKTWLKP
jgi:hypothetical protein